MLNACRQRWSNLLLRTPVAAAGCGVAPSIVEFAADAATSAVGTTSRRQWGSSADEVSTAEVVVVGAGVVGLAIARALSLAGREVVVLESEPNFGTGVSARNSEVIHAGIYYAKDSLKAALCVRGKQLMYDYCRERGIPHKRLGKLIVATTDAQVNVLDSIRLRAAANGCGDLRVLERAEALDMEPHLECKAALLSPSTGIVDSHSFMASLQAEAESAGATFAFNSRVVSGVLSHSSLEAHEIVVQDVNSGETSTLHASSMINAAGLGAPKLAASLSGMPSRAVPTARLAKGNYFSLIGRAPFKHLIYPVPVDGGLGTHLTLDLGGQARFGPDVEWVEEENYDVDARRADAFYPAIREYWPGLPDDSLQADYSGIRPKISGPGEAPADFSLSGPAQHGVPRLLHLFGIESPGLTSSLALAEEVQRQEFLLK